MSQPASGVWEQLLAAILPSSQVTLARGSVVLTGARALMLCGGWVCPWSSPSGGYASWSGLLTCFGLSGQWLFFLSRPTAQLSGWAEARP